MSVPAHPFFGIACAVLKINVPADAGNAHRVREPLRLGNEAFPDQGFSG